MCVCVRAVRFAMDRAGLVGADGATHCGFADVAYMGCLPNMVVMAVGAPPLLAQPPWSRCLVLEPAHFSPLLCRLALFFCAATAGKLSSACGGHQPCIGLHGAVQAVALSGLLYTCQA